MRAGRCWRSSRIEDGLTCRRRRTELSPPPAGDITPAISLPLDPENYPFTAYGEFGREHYPNFLAWLERVVQIQTYVHGPVGHGDVEIDAKDNTVFATTSFVSAWGLYIPNVLYVYHFDPLGSGKAVSQELYFDGPTAKYRNYTGFQAWLADGFVPPEPPPLPAAPCQFSPVPPLGFTGCTMFGSPSNTPAELANIEGVLASVTNLNLFTGTQNPSFLNSWLASLVDPRTWTSPFKVPWV